MNGMDRVSSIVPVATMVALCAALLLASGCGRPRPYTIHGPLIVSYEVQTSETTRSSSSGDADSVMVCDQCLIVFQPGNKAGTVLPLAKLNGFSWSRK